MPDSPTATFRTHANYLRAFDRLTFTPHPFGQQDFFGDLHQRITDSGILPQERRAELDQGQVRRSLHNAWGTEFLMLTSQRFAAEEDIIRLSNNWLCIQTYYVFYHCVQALAVAKGNPRPESHPRTQSLFCDYWANRHFVLPPWTLGVGADGARNAPPGIVINPNVHPWETCEGGNAWSVAAKALTTTRAEALQERMSQAREAKRRARRREWERVERERLALGRKPRVQRRFALPLLTPADKDRIRTRLRAYTVMDYLYRLRIKTNYVDSNMFTDGPEEEGESSEARRSLCQLASGTLFLHELALRRIVGDDVFCPWVRDWIERNMPPEMEFGVLTRRAWLGV